MSTVNTLLEGASPYQVLQEQAGKLAGKWERSGLLEGIESSTEKNNMSMLLENQAKQLVNEANTISSNNGTSVTTGNSEAWAGVALPLVRSVFGEIVAKDLVSVQPMNLPAGLIFYLDFQYGDGSNKINQGANESLYGATDDMKRTDGNFDKGLYGAGEFAYSSNSASAVAIAVDNGLVVSSTAGYCTGSATFNGILNGDTEFSASYAGQFGTQAGTTAAATSVVKTLMIHTGSLGGNAMDKDAIRAFVPTFTADVYGLKAHFPQFTRINNASGSVEFVISGASAEGTSAEQSNIGNSVSTTNDKINVAYFVHQDNFGTRGDFEDTTGANAGMSTLHIPSINVQMRSDTVSAKTRKLKAQWTPEFAQDLNAYHSIDAEAELTSILSEYISMEIDLEILDMLIRNADTVEGWSAAVAKDVTVSSNNTAGGGTNVTFSSTQHDMGVYYTNMSWFQTLGVKLQKVSNLIHQKTLRGGANWMVISPKVSTILESIPGFAADSAGDDDKYNMGVQKIGAINNRYTVYKNPYMTENVILMGYKGSQFLETGAVFAPYIPLIMTPLVYDPVSFTPRKGIMTRYAKKMVRPDFYGKVYIQDLNEL